MCRRNGEAQMDGNAVLMFSLNEVSDNIKKFRNQYGLTDDQIDYYVFHQGQKIILSNPLPPTTDNILAIICKPTVNPEQPIFTSKQVQFVSSPKRF